MLTAEMQRVLLLVALAVTAYMLILAWNDDYIKAPVAPPTVSEPVVDRAGAVAPSIRDVPESTASRPRTDAQAPQTDPAASTVLVHVTTGSMQLWIDKLGGDIVRVRLPRFPVSIEEPNEPFQLLDLGAGQIYVAQSGLIGPNGPDAGEHRPVYAVERNEFDLTNGGEVVLTTVDNGVEIRKIFSFTADEYVVGLSYSIQNRSSQPFEAQLYAQLKRDGHEVKSAGSYSLGPKPYLGAALTTRDERYHKLTFGDLDKGPFPGSDNPDLAIVQGGWIAMLQHYFISAWVGNAQDANHYYGRQQGGNYIVGYTGPMQTVPPNTSANFSSRFYAGPKDQERLEALAPNLNLTVDYGILWWLAGPLFHVLEWLHGIVKNWGFAIVLLTLLVKLVLYPLSAASYKSMANMRRVGPQMKRLQERYGDDRAKLSQEMMAFYKKEKINPLGGCLPMLLQMPVFLALYWVLFESVELRQAPFIFWIKDLAIMDPLFVLPILMGGSMFLTQALNPPVPDPVQARVMKFMPIMFTVMFLFFPAGLVLYWLVNNLMSLAQQWFITRQIEGGATPPEKS
jgi:YidC/Oxa1 family membrane protein insertase